MFRLLVLLIFAFTAFLSGALAVPGHGYARYAHIVVDADTGQILHSLNAQTKNYPASLTKIMTLFMTFESLKHGKLSINQKLPVSRVAQGRSPSRLGLRRGEKITVNNAIKALVTKSANDVATVLAEAIGSTERKFAVMMTHRARALGMKNTTFKNASGLPNRAQFSSAEDMAILARAMLYQHSDMYHHFARRKFTYKGRTYFSHNRLMKRYKGMDGIKTGYIRASGFNLVASAKRGSKRVIAIVFGGKTPRTRDRQVARLLDRGFGTLNERIVIKGKNKTRSYSSIRSTNRRSSSARPKHRPVNKSNNTHSRKGFPDLGVASGQVKSWAIQVGAYNRYGRARIAVYRAARAVPSLLGNKFQILQQKSKVRRGLQIYKARLLVQSESNARNSCRALKRRKIDCMVIWMGPRS
ncbi:MAG: D-alanyl-D-alanine carboxypeptidase family protein [Pseudomonadota bacterium]|nr:D-alanyl-D-alanine carboxypeptidase family protein [Pseudomonadota bacterium]